MAKDLFSKQASFYAKYRPGYPPELFEYILSFVKQKDTVWDCATGNGQAATELAKYFKTVHATDISEKQLQQAMESDRIIYAMASAESSGLPDHSIDLVTVAQAYHWFDFEAFSREVRRVAKPEGIIAIWGYGVVVCEDAVIHEMVSNY